MPRQKLNSRLTSVDLRGQFLLQILLALVHEMPDHPACEHAARGADQRTCGGIAVINQRADHCPTAPADQHACAGVGLAPC